MALKIKDVARKAGVSVATVSRVLNNSEKVSGETRDRVLKTIEELGYVPNYSAKSLRTRSSRGIGLVISHDVDYFLSFPYFAEFVHGMSSTLSEFDYHLVMVMEAPTEKRGDSSLKIVERNVVDGVILFDVIDDDERVKLLRDYKIPFVVVGRPGKVEDYTFVDSDNIKGAMLATGHLFDVGCKRVLFINGPKGHAASRYRLDGYIGAHKERGLPVREELIAHVEKDSDMKNGYDITKKALENLEFDGIFVSGDLMATGAMRAVEDSGLAVGKDIPVVGFDDVPLASLVSPALTTVKQPIKEIGGEAAKILVGKISGKNVKSRVFDVSLVVRKSTFREA